MEFAGISIEESYASSLGEEAGGVPGRWGEGCYVENLVKENERREKKRMTERGKVEFVPGRETVEGEGSKTSTPKAVGESGKERKKSRFDR